MENVTARVTEKSVYVMWKLTSVPMWKARSQSFPFNGYVDVTLRPDQPILDDHMVMVSSLLLLN